MVKLCLWPRLNMNHSLWMWSRQESFPSANMTQHSRGFTAAPVNIQILLVASQHLHLVVLHRLRIHKHPSSITVGYCPGRNNRLVIAKRLLCNRQLGSPRAPFRPILEATKRPTATRSREEAKLPAADDLEPLVADLKLAPPASVVPPRAETQVGSPATHKVGDAPVAVAVEDAAVAQISAAGDDEESAGRGPGLPEDDGLGDGDDGVVGGEEAAEGEDAVAHRLGCGAGAW
jgi:hypothetical protein